MYKVKVEVKRSSIDGKGVFSAENIPRGTIVWQYTKGHDSRMSVSEFNTLEETAQKTLKRVAYLSEQTNLWVIPPEDDPACFTNHSKNANTTIEYNPKISEEVIFIASRDIKTGEEITDNYLEFDPNADPAKQVSLK